MIMVSGIAEMPFDHTAVYIHNCQAETLLGGLRNCFACGYDFVARRIETQTSNSSKRNFVTPVFFPGYEVPCTEGSIITSSSNYTPSRAYSDRSHWTGARL